ISREGSVFENFRRRYKSIQSMIVGKNAIRERNYLLETASAGNNLSNHPFVDYIFTDPLFGGNLMYSALNFLWESWLKVFTNNQPEAVENKAQGKTLDDYRQLMTACFKEAYRVLKPGRWMTVEFSNTKASVWNAIQTALQEAGFIVAN